jgi:hypothetical protein
MRFKNGNKYPNQLAFGNSWVLFQRDALPDYAALL